MNVYTFIICILFTSVSDYKLVNGRSTYDNPSYNSDREENLSGLLGHQKKRLANDESFHEDPSVEFDRGAPLYEANRYRKFEPDAGFARRDRVDESKLGSMQKRDFYDPSSNAKDASIEVILDPRAKKAVASHPSNNPFKYIVLHNQYALVQNPSIRQPLISVLTKSGQAMYDLSGWKSKEEGPSYESDQFTPGTQQEQVVNLVYPAERTERKYATEFGSSSDYAEKNKLGFKDKVMATNEREDSHKRKRNVDTIKKEADKRSTKEENKSKRKSDQAKTESKQSECPPHNTPSSAEAENKDTSNTNENFENKAKDVKRDTSQWSAEQLSALKNSLNHVQDTNGEVQNLRSILSSMGLIDEAGEKKREADSKNTEKREDSLNADLKTEKEDEDLNQDNLMLKRNNREARNEEDNAAAEEPIEKRETDEESNYEEDANEEFGEKKDVKRASESELEEAKDEMSSKNEMRNKRQDSEKLDSPDASPSENEKTENAKKYSKREASEGSKEIRKNRDSQETEEEYERRMENQIQAKIDAIKEKVKREIMEEQYKRRFKRNNQEDLSINRKRRQAKDEDKVLKEESVDKSSASPAELQSKIVRRKRANGLPEKQMIYQGYQNGDADEAEEENEFDDNAFDGRMYNVEKRQAEDENDYYDPVRKREVESYLRQYYPESRNRRSFENDGYAEDAFHGSRRALKNKSFINRQSLEAFNSKSNDESKNEKVASDYFGSFPQSYNGELTRYKRVKRDNPYK